MSMAEKVIFSLIGAALAMPLAAADSTAIVELVRQQSEVYLGGTVIPGKQVTIAAQMPGRVEFLAGVEGDVFGANTALVALDDAELLAQRRAALAQMANADAMMRNAGVQFNRELVSPQSRSTMPGMGVPGMFDNFFTRGFSDMMGQSNSGFERHADIYSRSVGIEQARSSFTQARSQLEAVDARLRDLVGYAPFAGVIVEKRVEVGDTVQPGQPMLVFADTTALQVQVDIPARLMPGMTVGMLLPTRLDVHNQAVPARVAQVFPMADPARHTVTVKLDLPLDALAAPGMYAEVMLADPLAEVRGVPAVPRSALVQRGSLPTVCVRRADGGREMRVVRTGNSLADGRIAILAGLNGGEQVFLNIPPGQACR
jgi:multidrug efflux pump subunit AcrA (membrane-fusion protein)